MLNSAQSVTHSLTLFQDVTCLVVLGSCGITSWIAKGNEKCSVQMLRLCLCTN